MLDRVGLQSTAPTPSLARRLGLPGAVGPSSRQGLATQASHPDVLSRTWVCQNDLRRRTRSSPKIFLLRNGGRERRLEIGPWTGPSIPDAHASPHRQGRPQRLHHAMIRSTLPQSRSDVNIP